MLGRYNKADPLGLNAGFAAPDPKFADWKPPGDSVPVAGTRKDTRFIEENMWATKPQRVGRQHLGAYYSSEGNSSDESPVRKESGVPKLDGKGSWEKNWGVTPHVANTTEEKKEQDQKRDVATSVIPKTIEGMNKTLAERVKAAGEKSAAAYATGSAVKVAEKVSTHPGPTGANRMRPRSAFVPPHLRKKQKMQSSLPAVPKNAAPIKAHGPFIALKTTKYSDNDNTMEPWQLTHPGNTALSKLPSSPTIGRPELGTHWTAPGSPEARRPSTITLVGSELEDESLTRNIQAEEFGLKHIGSQAKNMIEQQYKRYQTEKKVTLLSPAVQGADLYNKVHRIHEILWKQETISLPGFAKTKKSLFKMEENIFQDYYAKVCSMFLVQWNIKEDCVRQVMKMQAEMEAVPSYSLDDLLAMNGDRINTVFEEITVAYNNKGSGSGSGSDSNSGPGYQFNLTEADMIASDDGDVQDFDSDGFGRSDEDEDEDDDDDDDEGLIVFKGRR